MDKLNTELRTDAVKLGLCNLGQSEWETNKTPQELVEMWVRGIDFAILHDYPSVDFIKANFDRDLLHMNLVYVDEEVEIQDAPSGIYVFCGDCRGTVEFAPWTAATVYVRHGSKLNIVAGDFAKVFIRLYDESEVSAEAEEDASVKVYDRRAIR